jgi:hypothetical protein
MDAWVYRLKRAYDAGYYKTESAPGDQSSFPWQNKSCKDCPFWTNGVCRVFVEHRGSGAHTCIYFDLPNREEAQDMIRARQNRGAWAWGE